MADPTKQEYVLWPYTPSIAGGAIACAVFALLTCAHIFRLVKNSTWFCTPFMIGGLFETIGYGARAAAHNDTVTKTPYIIQSVLVLIAPILFAASIYMVLGRLILRTGSASYSIVRANWVTKIFVTGDILCFFIQSGGAGMLVQASDQDGVKRGENIILGGLILQILIFMFFVIVAGRWHRRLESRPTAASADIPWQKMVCFLYATSIFITIRNMCRVIEYAMGKIWFPNLCSTTPGLTIMQEGYLLQHEWPLYIYDCLMMIATLAVCITWYDPNIKPGRKTDIEFGMRG